MLLLLTTLMLVQTPQPSAGCEAVSEYRLLAAWVGEWSVKNAAGANAGTSRVERSPDGCGLLEHWEGRNPAGQPVPGTGLHAFDRASQGWRHLWVDATGFTAVLTGKVESGHVVYERTSTQLGGVERRHRMTLAPADGVIVQTGEHSDDGGKTWGRDFQLTYRKKTV